MFPHVTDRPSASPLGETTAIATALGVALFVPVLAAVKVLTTPVYVASFHYFENQHSETAAYVLTFLVILPATVMLAPRLADWLEARLGEHRASLARALLVDGMLAALLLARIAPAGGSIVEVLVADAAWAFAAVILIRRAAAHPAPAGGSRLAGLAWPAAGLLAILCLFAFTSIGSISLLGVAVALVVAVALWLAPIPRLGRGPGRAADAAVVLLLALLIPDLVVFSPAGPGNTLQTAFTTRVIQFHQDFYLGPANVVMHGGAMLVDTASQYGVGPIYAIAAWFQVAPFGYGPLVFLDGCLYVLYFGAGYLILRLAGTSRGLASAALAVSVLVLIYNLAFPVGALLQHGPIRFGIPMLVIAGAVAEARMPTRRTAALAVQYAAVGLASIWALEAFAFAAATFLALRAFAAWADEAQLVRAVGRDIGRALIACVVFQAGLALATLAFRGTLPDWRDYFAFLREFLAGSVGDITYDFSAWSPGLAVAAGSFASAAGFLLLVRRGRGVALAHRPLVTAICGTTTFAIVLFYYFVDRSADHVLPYVSFPLVLAATLWLALLAAREGRASRAGRLAFAFAAAVAVLTVSVAWSSVGSRFSHSPLGELAPGGGSLRAALHELWHLPPLHPLTAQGEALLSRYEPGKDPAVMVLPSELQEEVLFRSDRVDAIAIGDPYQDSFAGTWFLDELTHRVDSLQPGTRVLISRPGLQAMRQLLADPDRDPVTDPITTTDGLTWEQEWVLRRIAQDFRFRVIHRDADYAVLELVSRTAGTARASR